MKTSLRMTAIALVLTAGAWAFWPRHADTLRVAVHEGRVRLETPKGEVEVPAGRVGWAGRGAVPLLLADAVADEKEREGFLKEAWAATWELEKAQAPETQHVEQNKQVNNTQPATNENVAQIMLLSISPEKGRRQRIEQALSTMWSDPDVRKYMEFITKSTQGKPCEEDAKLLLPYLEHPHRLVRYSAIGYLCLFGGRRYAPDIAKKLEDSDGTVRWTAANALDKLQEKSVIPQVEKLLDSEDRSVPYIATIVLCRLGAKEYASHLVTFLDDDRALVRLNVAEAVGQLSGQSWARNDPDIVEKARAWWGKHKDDPEFAPKKEPQ